MQEEIISLSEINLYLNLLEQQYNKKYNEKEYDKMIIDLKKEFGLNISKGRLVLLFEGSDDLINDIEDRYFVIRNIFG